MKDNKHQIDKVISFLKAKEKDLIAFLKNDPSDKAEKLELKEQIKNAIQCLTFCNDHDLVGRKREVIKIPEDGSDSYFTEYYLVDEVFENSLDNNMMKSNEHGKIKLNAFDLIVRTK
jgi:hypothetical protein